MVNYQNGLIYKIVCNDTNIEDCYVGSTCNFNRRKQSHKYACNNENGKKYNLRIYKFIRDNGGWDNWSMITLEAFSCENKRELETRERKWLEDLKANLNCFIPTRTKKEYDKLDERKKYQKEYKQTDKYKQQCQNYRDNNKQRIKERDSKLIECECGSISQIRQITRHKTSRKHKFYEKIRDFIIE